VEDKGTAVNTRVTTNLSLHVR